MQPHLDTHLNLHVRARTMSMYTLKKAKKERDVAYKQEITYRNSACTLAIVGAINELRDVNRAYSL